MGGSVGKAVSQGWNDIRNTTGQGVQQLGNNFTAGTNALSKNTQNGLNTLGTDYGRAVGNPNNAFSRGLETAQVNFNPAQSSVWKGVTPMTPFGRSSDLAQGLGTEENNLAQGVNNIGANTKGFGEYVGRQTGNPNNAFSQGLETYGNNLQAGSTNYAKARDSLNGPGVPPSAGPSAASPSPYSAAFSNGAGAQYGNSTAEQNFLNSYAQALKPNTNFDINAQTNPLTSSQGFKNAMPGPTAGVK